MQYKRFGDQIVVRLDSGDDIHGSLREVCAQEKVAMGSITGFGGISYIKVGIWNNGKKEYDFLTVEQGDMELLNLTGNISCLNGEPFTHCHVTAADTDFHVFGGHLVTGTVQNLMELYISVGVGTVQRIPDGQWNVLDLT